MKRILFATVATMAFGVSGAMAAEGVKLSQSECTSVWQQANPNNAAGLTKAQAAPYVTNFQAANPDGDQTIDANEWMLACSNGLIKSAGNAGASSGAAGSSDSGSSRMKQE